MSETEPKLLCTAFNVTKERAVELVDKYVRNRFNEYLKGELSNGDLVATVMNLDELSTNEKCFLTCHTTTSTILADQERKRRAALANLLMGGF